MLPVFKICGEMPFKKIQTTWSLFLIMEMGST